ncbi:DEAD/DEAH box helicase [Pseudomonas sp. CMR5c]|uniref:DEAD/DEAH box helicase n=1 Tax=Pseudomonas sp. CMR5c TaxID=658630 RepID=UPI00069DF665|nr:ATP-binding domain-containing protein [Pseudomonas sp. CMR5c]AZC15601.1 putative DNA/RNA helicase [Pseudomonas sp. CMR5c]
MSSSFFYMSVDEDDNNHTIIEAARKYAENELEQVYIVNKPLGDNKYSYSFSEGFVLLVPKHKMLFINFGSDEEAFEEFQEDFLEDLSAVADKYRYKTIIGRPRTWSDLYSSITIDPESFSLPDILDEHLIPSDDRQKKCELLISLITGSINDIDRVKEQVPDNLLDKVKQKILLFDGEQTRFVYQKSTKPVVRIQGLSGTGKTELLLHKLKEIYTASESTKIFFTCHNKILADSLKKRIPDFFNFMKVEQQIEWSERLWCDNAWGSGGDYNSGAYRYICHFYGLTFHRYSPTMSFDRACKIALEEIAALDYEIEPALDYMLIDESQDFPESFFELCQKVTSNTVYIAGDIFQNIFSDVVGDIKPDFLLSKCYRTDPRTLMFAHSLGMGLFEKEKLQWLADEEWQSCGYIVDKDRTNTLYRLSREPLRRFEDVDSNSFTSTEIVLTGDDDARDGSDTASTIIKLISEIKQTNPTATVEDIGVIFLSANKRSFRLADVLEQSIPKTISWKVNKAYESKRKIKDTLFVSNRNHVKGLEFPFVICVAETISRSHSLRNALYMMLTRSFIKTYLLIPKDPNQVIYEQLASGLDGINKSDAIEVIAPSAKEIEKIRTKINFTSRTVSYYEFLNEIFNELNVLPIFRSDLTETVRYTLGDSFDRDEVMEVVEFNYRKMAGR